MSREMLRRAIEPSSIISAIFSLALNAP